MTKRIHQTVVSLFDEIGQYVGHDILREGSTLLLTVIQG